MFKKRTILSLFLVSLLASIGKNIYSMGKKSDISSDSHDFNAAEIKDFKPNVSSGSFSSDLHAAKLTDFVRDLKSSSSYDFDAVAEFRKDLEQSSSHDFDTDTKKLIAYMEDIELSPSSTPKALSSSSSSSLKTPIKRNPQPLSCYKPATRIAKIAEEKEEAPQLTSSQNNNSSAEISSSSSSVAPIPSSFVAASPSNSSSSASSSTTTEQRKKHYRERSATVAQLTPPNIKFIDEAAEEETSATTDTKKTTDQKKGKEKQVESKKKKKFKRSNSAPKLETWVFNNLRVTICTRKGELEKIYEILALLYQDTKITGNENATETNKKKLLLRTLLRLHHWVHFSVIKPNLYKEMPQDLKEFCITNNLCDEENKLTDLAKYTIIAVFARGQFTNLTKLIQYKKVIQALRDRKEEAKKEMVESDIEAPYWKFQTHSDDCIIGFLRVKLEKIKKTYKKMLSLNTEQLYCLSQIIINTQPTTQKYIDIRNFLIKKHLINSNGTIPLLVKYLHEAGKAGITKSEYIPEKDLLESCVKQVSN